MKVIFLDIDGVLNSEESAIKHHNKTGKNGYGGFFEEHDICTHENVIWNIGAVNRLKDICNSTGAKIVISSTWRKHFSVNKFKEMFSVYGWHDAPVIDMTPLLHSYGRGLEIQSWIKNQTEEIEYVIIDDITGFLEDQMSRLVNTSFWVGLIESDKEQAISLLT